MNTDIFDYAHGDPPTEIAYRPPTSDRASATPFSMSSFGIAEDPDAESRRKRGLFFGIGVGVVAVIAAVMISRASHEPIAAKPVETKPPPAAPAAPTTPPPPPETKPAPAVPAVEVADEKKPEAETTVEDKAKSKAAKRAAHRHGKKRG
ncbi:MAG: hypothetical protein KIT84_32335 [Labilithrix sp.]|nr:hypothetical protein [Labilithrix sp.]MCW5815762.1 hypothetical protein [Labilithrix sp.]